MERLLTVLQAPRRELAWLTLSHGCRLPFSTWPQQMSVLKLCSGLALWICLPDRKWWRYFGWLKNLQIMEFPSASLVSSLTSSFSPTPSPLVSLEPAAGSYPFSLYLLCQEAQAGVCLIGWSGEWNKEGLPVEEPEEKPLTFKRPSEIYMDNAGRLWKRWLPNRKPISNPKSQAVSISWATSC